MEVLGGSLLVFEGRFDLTTASAFSHTLKAWEFGSSHLLDQALLEARTAVALAPRMVGAHFVLGEMLAESKRTVEARQAYETALALARTIHPDYQWYWIPYLQEQLAHP